jgi:hypothetical protein
MWKHYFYAGIIYSIKLAMYKTNIDSHATNIILSGLKVPSLENMCEVTVAKDGKFLAHVNGRSVTINSSHIVEIDMGEDVKE